MDTCKIANGLYAAVPLRFFRNLLIRRHMDRCPGCQAKLASRDEASALFVRPADVGGVGRLWRRIEEQTLPAAPMAVPREAATQRRQAFASRLSLVAGAAAALFTAAAGFWLLRGVETSERPAAALPRQTSFEIKYVNAGGAPAEPFVFRPGGSDTIFVWAAKIL